MWVALVLQIAGIMVTVTGVGITWRDFAVEGERFWSPLTDPPTRWVRSARRWIASRVSRQEVRAGGDLTGPRGTLQGSGRVFFPPLPPLEDPGFLTGLQQRLDHLQRSVQSVEQRQSSARMELECADAALRKSLDERISNVEQLTRRVATGGLRLEVLGIGLVAAATVMQSLAQAGG